VPSATSWPAGAARVPAWVITDPALFARELAVFFQDRTGTTSGSSARCRSAAPTSAAGSERGRCCSSATKRTPCRSSRTAARTAAR
jgi:hypothetical protein